MIQAIAHFHRPILKGEEGRNLRKVLRSVWAELRQIRRDMAITVAHQICFSFHFQIFCAIQNVSGLNASGQWCREFRPNFAVLRPVKIWGTVGKMYGLKM